MKQSKRIKISDIPQSEITASLNQTRSIMGSRNLDMIIVRVLTESNKVTWPGYNPQHTVIEPKLDLERLLRAKAMWIRYSIKCEPGSRLSEISKSKLLEIEQRLVDLSGTGFVQSIPQPESKILNPPNMNQFRRTI